MASGIVLGLFLKLIQFFTNLKVYTLLLNVDYVPILKYIPLPETVEFGLHLVISMVLAISVNFYITRKGLQEGASRQFIIRVSLLVGLFLYSTTLLSDRTPSLTNSYAFLTWMAGHWIYGLILGRILSYKEGERV